MYLIFDTETTGLPRDYHAPLTDFDNWPRVVQLAWQLHDERGKLLAVRNYIVRPDGFTIPYNSEKVHGISTQRAMNEGSELEEVLTAFMHDLELSSLLIGHNIEFDLSIMGCEFLRCKGNNPLEKRAFYCTKIESTDFVALPGGKGGKFKWPTLTELHQKLFNEAIADAHDAAFDVSATARCFFGLISHGVYQPQSGIAVHEIVYEAPELEASNFDHQEKKAPSSPPEVPDKKEVEVVPYVHLHNHSQYSILQATTPVKTLIQRAKQMGMSAVALTDLGNMFGAFYAVAAGEAEGIKVILGCECYVAEERLKHQFTKDNPDRRFQQVLLAKNKQGYQNLIKLCSLGYMEGYYAGFPRVDKELIRNYSEHLIATTGGLSGEIPQLILNVGDGPAREAFLWWKEVFGDNFYVELQRHGLEEENRVNEVLVKWAREYQVKMIASNNTYYLDRDDATALDALLCVKDAEYVSTPIGRGRGYRYGMPNDSFYFKSAEEMSRLFSDIPEALTQTVELADQIEPISLKRDILLPNFPLPSGFDDENVYLRHLTLEGAQKKYGKITDELQERIDHELEIISSMGFPGYFLITADMINAGRKMGVRVGPGRGSAAGSVVAYCIGITNIDPIRYNLLFERFLNPERISMPDIDTDFDDEGRQKVIDYVVDKYGYNQVAHIITYGTMAAKSSIRDVGRVLEYPLSDTNALAKLVPERIGISLEKALSEVSDLRQIRKEGGKAGEVIKLAEKLEGSVRNTGIHAAGIIIAPNDLTEYIPVATSKDSHLLVTQFDGKIIEEAGMLKMDFLGLKTLSIINDALKLIERNRGEQVDIDNVPLDDEQTFHLYQRGDTIGTFQFESPGMRKYLQQLKPSSIEDLIAMNALYRPGPMEFIPNFIDRKHGREPVAYPHELLEDLLKPTYGIMVYQEQIMQTAQIIGGFSLGKADILRRAMGKKKMDVMQSMKIEFVEGAAQKGIEAEKAEEIFAVMEKFAAYGFNRSHSAAYSVVAYQTAYLKAHYPAEYMAAVLTHNQNNIDKVTFFMDECRRQSVKVLGPDLNESHLTFDVNDQGEIRFGLAAIKGTGESAVEAIIQERNENGPFQNLFEFSSRVNLRAVNKKTFEALALAGAFDTLGEFHRKQYIYEPENDVCLIEKVIKYGNLIQQEANSQQHSLFGDDTSVQIPIPKIPPCEPYGDIEKLRFEKEVVGFYLSGHPLDQFKLEMKYLVTCPVTEVEDYKDKEISIGGIVTSASNHQSRNGNPYGRFSIEDYEGTLDMVLFGENYRRNQHMLHVGEFVYVTGKVEPRRDQIGIYNFMPHTIQLLSDVKSRLELSVLVSIPLQELTREAVSRMVDASSQHPGKADLKVAISHGENGSSYQVVALARKVKVDPNADLLEALEDIPGIKIHIKRS